MTLRTIGTWRELILKSGVMDAYPLIRAGFGRIKRDVVQEHHLEYRGTRKSPLGTLPMRHMPQFLREKGILSAVGSRRSETGSKQI
jgi:hypothetical protein